MKGEKKPTPKSDLIVMFKFKLNLDYVCVCEICYMKNRKKFRGKFLSVKQLTT